MRKAILIVACLAMCASLLAAVTQQDDHRQRRDSEQKVLLPQLQQPLNVKTGLWQVEMNLNYSGLPPQMQAMLDHMTPQQRAAAGLGGTKAYRQCLTPKELNKPMVQGEDTCRWTVLMSTSSDLDVHGTGCQVGRNQGLNTEVEVKVHAIDSEHVKATVHGTGTGNGVSATLDGNYTGKWIGATCPAE